MARFNLTRQLSIYGRTGVFYMAVSTIGEIDQ